MVTDCALRIRRCNLFPLLRRTWSFHRLLALRHRLLQYACIYQMARYIVKHAVDIASRTGRGVEFCQTYILVYRHVHGNFGECEHLRNGKLHDDHIHVCQTREIPVAARLGHIALVLVGIQDCGTKKLHGKLPVLLAVVFRQQFLVAAIGWVEPLDCLQHESINHILVVIPLQGILLKRQAEVVIVLNEELVELAPQLTMGIVIVCL